MLPPFNDDGYLPSGIHPAKLEEIAARFGTDSEIRQVQMESLRWLVDLAWKAGALRIVVNGSFTTDRYEPNDVDCVLLFDGGFTEDSDINKELKAGLPFINMELVDWDDFKYMTEEYYATDREEVPKGVVEVIR